ncbi:MAG: S8 family serine peptidase, partial [Deltaproteobacteria bacterium]|nr:S8 family serine peptidase [Deltaproteobacteria bacterium]MBW2535385.1 S8 family serine peptidase [Deltaproteobacteria bacterium]
ARADAPAASVVRFLRPRASPHPLADRRGRLPLLVELPSDVSAEERGLLPVAPGMGAAYLTVAEWRRFTARHPDLIARLSPPRRPLLDVAEGWTRSTEFRVETGLDGTGVVVGIIDTGLDVTHPDFLHPDGSSRVAWMMIGGEPLHIHPELEQRYGCTDPAQSPCAILSAAEIDERLSNAVDGDEPTDRTGHGTHVASTAAGNGGVLPGLEPRFVGVAPGATLIVAAPSPSNEFSDPAILNSARFVFELADAMNMPAVVNVSLGSDFGPHDGTSALEKGLAAMVGPRAPGHALVVAAGNSGDLYRFDDGGPFGVHTEVHVSPSAVSRVPMTVPGWEGTVSGTGYVWITFRPGDEVAVGLEGPEGDEWIGLVDPGEEAGYESDGDSAGVINNLPSAGSTITADTNSAVVIFDGSWAAEEQFAVLLQGRGDAQLWVTGTGGVAPGAAGLGLSFEKATKPGTIGVPATHPDLIAVGCTLNRIIWKPFGVPGIVELAAFGGLSPPVAESTCYFSGAGPTPTGNMKPDLLAPGAYVAGAMSRDADPRRTTGGVFEGVGCPADLPACHVVDDGHALTTGTSMASPQVAGAIALLLQRAPDATQAELRELLQAGAHHPQGAVPADYQLGAGALDLLGALDVLEAQDDERRQADPAWSYFVLSSPYARPDPSWPVHGLVQLRTGDGGVAVHPTVRPSLHVDGGTVVQPLTLVRGGMWRFTVAAPSGSGGEVLRIEVRYRGASLGVKALPIGADQWIAESGITARGSGCTVATAGRGANRRGLPAWLLLGAATWGLRRRGRHAARLRSG